MNRWRIIKSRSDWPTCINRPKDKDSTPIWVWGDTKLAARIVRLLNGNKPQRLHDLLAPTIEVERRVSAHLEPYVCFESLRKDVIDDINRLIEAVGANR